MHHYTEQYKYIDLEYNINIIKFENLNEELKKYNLNIIINKEKINTKNDKNNEINFKIKDFNKKLIKLINEIYHNDFLMFNYKKLIFKVYNKNILIL